MFAEPHASPSAREPRIPRAFTHAAFWIALALLLLNDHWFKGRGILPAVLTGKLSDFAGMLVAPPLLACLLDPRRAWVRGAAPLAVGTTFAALKLVPSLAHLAELGLTALGLRSQIWVDPSDLWALLALPFAAPLCRPALAPSGARSGLAKFAVQRVGIALAAFACVATSGVDKQASAARKDAPAIVNGTSETLQLVISSTDGSGGCSLYRDDRVSLLTADAFAHPRQLMLKPKEQAPLAFDTTTAACGAASVSLADGTETRVFWRGLDEIPSFVPSDDARRAKRMLTLSGKSSPYDFELGDDLHELTLGGDLPESTCPTTDPTDTLEASVLAMPQGFLQLSEIRHTDDGCFEVDWFMAEGDSSPDTQRLCVPDWAFPFDKGERLAVTQELGGDGSRTLHVSRFDGATLRLQLVIWNDATTFPDSSVKSIAAVDCVGTRVDCGAYERPVEVTVRGKSSVLRTGDETTIKGNHPKSTRMRIGPAREVAWNAPTCQGVEARAGASASILELRTY